MRPAGQRRADNVAHYAAPPYGWDEGQTVSLRRRTQAADKWAAVNGMVIDESLTDLGVSAFRGLNRHKDDFGKLLDLEPYPLT